MKPLAMIRLLCNPGPRGHLAFTRDAQLGLEVLQGYGGTLQRLTPDVSLEDICHAGLERYPKIKVYGKYPQIHHHEFLQVGYTVPNWQLSCLSRGGLRRSLLADLNAQNNSSKLIIIEMVVCMPE